MNPIFLALLLQASATGPDAPCYATAETQLAFNECAEATLELADSELAAFVASYESKLPKEQLALLHSSQAAWEQFRQAACKFEASGISGGSAHPMILARCLASRSKSRLLELHGLATCQDGDYACPLHDEVAPNNSFKGMPLRGTPLLGR